MTAILIGLVVAAGAAFYIAQPLLRPARRQAGAARPAHEQVEAAYRATLEAIRDLDFDFQTGKVAEQDYGPLREKYAAQGAALLQELDQTRRTAPPDEVEALILARRQSSAACPACGKPAKPTDRFCGKCGAALGKNHE